MRRNADRRKSNKKPITYTQKMSVATTSVSVLYLLPAAMVQAAVVHVTGSPVSISFSDPDGTVAWDIDGVGNPEFGLNKGDDIFPLNATAAQLGKRLRIVSFSGSLYTGTGPHVYVGNYVLPNPLNGRGIVAPNFRHHYQGQPNSVFTDNILNLPGSFSVGPEPLGTVNGYTAKWGNVYTYRAVLWQAPYYGYTQGAAFAYDMRGGKWGDGVDGFMGFRFDPDDGQDGLHYGYALVNFDSLAGSVTIKEWFFETEVDTALHIESTPEPGTSSLVLLGLGAAGIRAWRSRRKGQQHEPQAEAS